MDRIAGSIARLKGWRRAAAAIAAGGVSALALAPFNLFPLLWVTIPVFVWLIDGAAEADGRSRGRTFLAGAAAGWCFGFGYFLGGLWWIGAAFLVDGDQFAWLMPIAVVILPAGLALFWGLGAGVAALFWCPGWPRILVFASAFAAVEWLRGHVLTGFPWNAFGYTSRPAPVMMQSAAVVGLWGLTLAAFIIFAAPAALWPAAPPARRGASAFAAFAAALFAAHLGFGAIRLAGAEDPAGGPTVRIVQPALDQSEKWQAENEDEIVARYLELSRTVSGAGPDLDDPTVLIWPESAFPFLLTDRPDVLSAIADLLPEGTTLVTGAVRADEPAGDSIEAFNSVLVIDDRGTITAAYDKVHLVPFGEYLPFRPLFDLFGIRQLVAIPGRLLGGRRPADPDAPRRPSLCAAHLLRDHLPRGSPGDRPSSGVDPQSHQRHLVRRYAGALSAFSTGTGPGGRGRAAPGACGELGDIGDCRFLWSRRRQPRTWNCRNYQWEHSGGCGVDVLHSRREIAFSGAFGWLAWWLRQLREVVAVCNAIDINHKDVLSPHGYVRQEVRCVDHGAQELLLWRGREVRLAMDGQSAVQEKECRARPKRECLNGQ